MTTYEALTLKDRLQEIISSPDYASILQDLKVYHHPTNKTVICIINRYSDTYNMREEKKIIKQIFYILKIKTRKHANNPYALEIEYKYGRILAKPYITTVFYPNQPSEEIWSV